ncbi:Golgi transport complex subunit 4 [Cyanidiococcus yangmingshanensis]|uniref:Golgi transport complex subunit 4 n=1 Tax=Cyanidiococcus yangmingshanensis TaxID=2690220 RepID=A0A7J7IMN9_9RHOD|nr:Golgi transport complex subunit 4 [Cyanidiococcus yangmingshanensis]
MIGDKFCCSSSSSQMSGARRPFEVLSKRRGLNDAVKGAVALHQHRFKASSAPSIERDTETIYDVELVQLGNVAQIGNPRGAAPLKDGNRESVESDTSELEVLLEQLVIMSRRTAMFRHFLLSRLGIATDFEQERRREGPLYLMMQELMGMYVLLEQHLLHGEWLAARALEDTTEQTGSDQPIDRDQASKPVEYTFYAIKRSVGRAIQAYDPEALCATLNHVNGLLTGPCLENLTKQLQTELPSLSIFNPAQMVFGHSFKVETLRGLIRSTNDAQTSSLYVRRLIGVTIPKGISEAQLPESASLAPILMEMQATAEEFQQLASQGIRGIFQTLRTSALERVAEQALRVPAPSSSATNASAAWSYQISESTYQPGPSLPVARLFELVHQEALEPLLPQLTTDAFAELVCLVAEWTRDRFEQATIGRRCPMNALGALAFDADVRYLMNRFAGLAETHRTRCAD